MSIRVFRCSTVLLGSGVRVGGGHAVDGAPCVPAGRGRGEAHPHAADSGHGAATGSPRSAVAEFGSSGLHVGPKECVAPLGADVLHHAGFPH